MFQRVIFPLFKKKISCLVIGEIDEYLISNIAGLVISTILATKHNLLSDPLDGQFVLFYEIFSVLLYVHLLEILFFNDILPSNRCGCIL